MGLCIKTCNNTMLYAVLFVQSVWEYAGVGVGNLFFFGGGEKREGKSSFAVFGFAVGKSDCKCAFSYGAGAFALFLIVFSRILNFGDTFLIGGVKMLKFLTNFLSSEAKTLSSCGSFLNVYVKILKFYINFLKYAGRILNFNDSFLKYGGGILFFGCCLVLNEKSCLDFEDNSL